MLLRNLLHARITMVFRVVRRAIDDLEQEIFYQTGRMPRRNTPLDAILIALSGWAGGRSRA